MARHTRFAGSDEPLHIFQDDMYENVTPMTSHAPMPAVPSTRPNRRPLTSSSTNVVFNPPNNPHANYSPFKSRSNSMGHAHSHAHAHAHAPLQSSHGNRLNMVPMAPPMAKGRATTDSLQKKPYLSNFKTIPQKMGMDMNFGYGKENVHPQIYPAPAALNLSVENFYQKPNGKRGLMEAAPIKKRVKMEHGIHSGLDSFPRIVDDGNKPPHSYAQLIGMAILRSPKKMLTLSQIYKWISDNYSFYSLSESGWQNSIRHNLSLHKNFIKIERPKEDPGKGNYWGIEPGTESQFLKEKPARKSAPTAENLPVMSTRLEPSRPTPVPMQEPTLPPPAPLCQAALPPLPTSQATMSMAPDISSDATIPISDNIGPEDALDKRIDNNDILDSSLYSPLPAAMNSSPPVSRHINHRSNTPPPASHNMLSSAARSHKRKFASMDDSGYISSLESSVLRPNASTRIPTSEADRPRIKRGRAEEEIARLRGSSPYSPTKGRSMSLFSLGPVSSSPLRQAHEGLGLGLFPLTPVVKFKPPVRPPPSASPNTNLRLHRDKVRHMLQSPLRRVVGAEDAIPWSPAFNLDDTVYNLDCDVTNTGEFDIWHDLQGLDDNVFSSMSSADAGSPVKRSARRARLDRSASTSALGDITNLAPKKLTPVPLFKIPEHPSTQFLETPSKAFEGLSSPAKLLDKSPIANQSPTKFTGSLLELPVDGDWPALMGDPADYISNDHTSVADFSGLDILQGFEKIGSGSQNPKPRGSKPGLGRSYSTAF